MGQRCPLFLCVAGIEANDLAQSDSGSERWLWRNLPLSSGSARVLSIQTTPIRVSDFIGSDATKTFFIPLRSWRQAPQPPAIRSRIGTVVVEESVIEFWDCQDSIKLYNFMNNSLLGMNLIPLDSWHRAQEPPGVGFRIDFVAVVECCRCGSRVWMLSVLMKRVSRHIQFEAKCRETTSH